MRLPTNPWWDTFGLGAIALAVTAPRLGDPAVLVFDEFYYVSDAVALLNDGVVATFTAHPPLGTWLIAAGMSVFGRNPVGWRLAVLVAGVLSVVLLHRLALRLLSGRPNRRPASAAAALLLISEGSWFVLARTAMLDGMLVTFVLAATVAAAASADTSRRRAALWTLSAGAAVGAAIAVKWSGAVAAPLAFLVVLGRDPTALRDGARRAVGVLPLLALGAAVVYGAAWIPYGLHRGDVDVATCPDVAAPCATRGGVQGVLAQHASLLRYHTGLDVAAPAATPPEGWPLMQRPVRFYRPDCHTRVEPVTDPIELGVDPVCEGTVEPGSDTITLLGNPVIWFGFLALLPLLTALAGRDRAAATAVLGWTASWLPWLFVSRTAYLWYLAPAIPFAALGVVVATTMAWRVNIFRVYLVAAVSAVVGGLVGGLATVPIAGTILGWGLGGAVARSPVRDERGPEGGRILAGVVVTAIVTAVVLSSEWVASAPQP